ncbi:hypothetical protein CALVIDRAFT_569871 [Calocera viscosa TUFC12733]|uniref:Uncharacterized protein n=1 Tax=Calocera viscosa (strain TUFC12733) TaxID=1330018 RepID=A0A167FHJ9_CALVF|nr:hypothetical protein CALVIDRAFT_569871 [Calocera viscosa TUFC12733]
MVREDASPAEKEQNQKSHDKAAVAEVLADAVEGEEGEDRTVVDEAGELSIIYFFSRTQIPLSFSPSASVSRASAVHAFDRKAGLQIIVSPRGVSSYGFVCKRSSSSHFTAGGASFFPTRRLALFTSPAITKQCTLTALSSASDSDSSLTLGFRAP